MKLSYNWLKDYIDISISPEKLADVLTFIGIEVEKIEYTGALLQKIVIGKVESVEKHPNADKLSICRVCTGDDTLQVICGAPNVKPGIKVPFAPIGAKLGGQEIKKVKLRGVESYGMICSEKELDISDEHEGIMILPDDAPLGDYLSEYINKDDVCYELEITPNRPDLLGILGIARDLSAKIGSKLRLPTISLKSDKLSIKEYLRLENKEPKLCSRYTAKVIKNVQVTDSPAWLQEKLISIGLRPINNIVDITNFVMMEYGHPLHAFDYEKIKGKKIVIRTAKNDEKFYALDEETYTLKDSELVIADEQDPIALAGIIGGNNSHITSNTKTIVLEAANFLYASIRETAERLKISTDSSYRFERDLADQTAAIISDRAAQMIAEIAGGEVLDGTLDSYPEPKEEKIVALRYARLHKLLSIDISQTEVKKYLQPLGLKVVDSDEAQIGFSIPLYRKDLSREVDLIEEVIRLHGFDKVPSHEEQELIMNWDWFKTRRKIEDLLVERGFNQVVNWSFSHPEHIDKFGFSQSDFQAREVAVKNPLGTSFSILRTMLLPNLLENASHNIKHSQHDIRLFELDKIFIDQGRKLPKESFELSGLMSGNADALHWSSQERAVDFFDVKGVCESILESCNVYEYSVEESKLPFYLPGHAVDIFVKKQKIGNCGKLDAKIAEEFEIEQPLFVFNIYLDELLSAPREKVPHFTPISKYPTVERDISFVVSKDVAYQNMVEVIQKAEKKNIKKISLIDEYTGKGVSEGFRSLTFKLDLGADTKTLTDNEINRIVNTVIEKLKNKFEIVLR